MQQQKVVVVTGSQGFIGSYICKELLNRGYFVYGLDNFSKYGKLSRPHDKDKNFQLIELDCRYLAENCGKLSEMIKKDHQYIDCIIQGAAKIGGISYFHKYSYDLLSANERILASVFDWAIDLYKNKRLGKILVLSSSMVFENATQYPTPEEEIYNCPPPNSAYGFQKLASEYFAKAAWDQYGLPFIIIRPFNCVGVGEDSALGESEITSGNIKLMMSHVLPDLVNKILKGQNPLHILGDGHQVRCYTNGNDIARGIVISIENPAAINHTFNISTSETTSVRELSEKIWRRINKNVPFQYVCDEPYEHDVQNRVPDVSLAKRILGFESKVSLDQSIDEVIEYMRGKIVG